MHLIAAPALGVARLCVDWARQFLARRVVDGRPLGDYEEIQRQLADSLADTFAIGTTAQRCLHCEDQNRGLELRFEQNMAKNTGSPLSWGIADRTMSLLAAERYETAASKHRRNVPAVPLERYLRDLRNLRTSGGVDFQLDNWICERAILTYYYPEPDHTRELLVPAPRLDTTGSVLSNRNLAHLHDVAEQTHRFGYTCLQLAREFPNRADLVVKECPLATTTPTRSAGTHRRSAKSVRHRRQDGQATGEIPPVRI